MRQSHVMIRAVAAIAALVVLSGCAATPMTAQLTQSPPQGLPVASELPDVPFFAQTEFYCGPAALATVFNATGLETEPGAIAQSVYTPGRQGTLQTEIITGTRRQGMLALALQNLNDVFMNVSQGRPVLVLQNLSLAIAPRWHYAVVVGYDLADETVVLRSGTTFRKVMSMKTFEHTWRRAAYWGVVVVRPDGPVPDSTTLSQWLQEAYGIERAGRAENAMTAFIVASRHWPKAGAPLVSAANILIEANRLEDAKNALQSAVEREPENAIALNNLAHVLMRLGDLDAAERSALKAIDTDGAIQSTARETLSEIQALQYNARK